MHPVESAIRRWIVDGLGAHDTESGPRLKETVVDSTAEAVRITSTFTGSEANSRHLKPCPRFGSTLTGRSSPRRRGFYCHRVTPQRSEMYIR